ncbi:MAG: oligopeptide transporter, OPT family [Planctomycetes bacterium]|nr:oligopeptide transporter, OPT family [Planctomycetota bacterium]
MAHTPPEPEAKPEASEFQPYVPPEQTIPEFSLKAILFGALFGIVFGASTVYLALRAGLTVSASIPIAVLAISVLRPLRATILENNIVQTIGSAGESVAAGVAFTIPALLLLSPEAGGKVYFEYIQIMTLAAAGGILGTLFMVPLRRSLIVAEHGNLPYPEGTACADVLIAGEKGGKMAGFVFGGVIVAFVHKVAYSVFGLWRETVAYVTPFKTAAGAKSAFPNATFSADLTPEYLGVGYILGPKVGGIMVAGGVLSYIVLIPLLTLLLPEGKVVQDLLAQGVPQSTIDGYGEVKRYYEAYIRFIGAGAVTMAGIITLLKTLPTIWRSLRDSFAALRAGGGGGGLSRTERDIPITWVILGSIGLVGVLALLPILPGSFGGRAVMAVLMLVFGFFFVTVSSRIVGLIGSSSNPISGMTIATLLGTSLVFVSLGMGGKVNEPIALCVGAIVCIAAANAGATSQDLKTGFLVGATPVKQQVGLVIGVLVSTVVIGATIMLINDVYAPKGADGLYLQDAAGNRLPGIGADKFPAPQANLMATVIKGVMSQNLPWGYILVGAGLALMVFLCGVSPLAWAVGAYLPLGTTMPIFFGGLMRGLTDKLRGEKLESELAPGMLFATGLVAGGALTGVASGALKAIPSTDGAGKETDLLAKLLGPGEHWLATMGERWPGFGDVLSLAVFGAMTTALVVIGRKKLASGVGA